MRGRGVAVNDRYRIEFLAYTPLPTDLTTDDFLIGTLYCSDYCVLVNALGLRFKDESVGCLDEVNAQHGSRQPGGRYYLLFDERIRRAFVDADLVGLQGLGSARKTSRIDDVRKLGGTVLEADSLPVLCDRVVDLARLVQGLAE